LDDPSRYKKKKKMSKSGEHIFWRMMAIFDFFFQFFAKKFFFEKTFEKVGKHIFIDIYPFFFQCE
jgi:hypothetical protein